MDPCHVGFLVSLRCDLLLKQKWCPSGLLSLQLIQISRITATKICGRICDMLMGFGFDWKMNMEHKNGGIGRWFAFSIRMTLRGPAVNFPGCTFIHPKKTGWLQLGKWNLGVWKCFVKVIFVCTIFLREFPPILGTVFLIHRKDVHLEKVILFVWKKIGQFWNACLRLPDFLLICVLLPKKEG